MPLLLSSSTSSCDDCHDPQRSASIQTPTAAAWRTTTTTSTTAATPCISIIHQGGRTFTTTATTSRTTFHRHNNNPCSSRCRGSSTIAALLWSSLWWLWMATTTSSGSLFLTRAGVHGFGLHSISSTRNYPWRRPLVRWTSASSSSLLSSSASFGDLAKSNHPWSSSSFRLTRATTATTRWPVWFPTSVVLRGGGRSPTTTTTTTRLHSTTTTTTESTTMTTTTTSTTTTVTSSSKASEKLAALRQCMQASGIDIYLVPSDDPHLSEYTPAAYQRRSFLTNFGGSAGTAVIPSETAAAAMAAQEQAANGINDGSSTDAEAAPATSAFLWTDSRYWNEAGLQLDSSHWVLQKQGLPSTPSIATWIAQQAVRHYQETKQPLKVGMDPYVHSAAFPKELKAAFLDAQQGMMIDNDNNNDEQLDDQDGEEAEAEEVVLIGELVLVSENLVDAIWSDRPALPLSPFRVHPLDYAGVSWQDKVQRVREAMRQGGAAATTDAASVVSIKKKPPATLAVFCTLDDVAYLLNLRAQGDIYTAPVGIAYATVSMDQVCLYCDPAKIASPEVQQHLENVTLRPYDAIAEDIVAHCAASKRNRVWLDQSRSNYAICQAIPTTSTTLKQGQPPRQPQLLDGQNAIVPMKACKNRAELEGMRQAHIVDGAAMAEFMAWLEDTVVNQGRAVSEVEIDQQLTGCRAKQPGFLEVSFETIAGVGSNGAIIHYRAKDPSDLLKYLDTNNPILIDSGGQYTYGTTDVTRTWHFGTATPEFRDMYTRVLKGNIGLDSMVFPEHTTPGFVLDVFARKWLWEAGRDYGHGTGHGVGAALNVHEGPMSISPKWANKEILKKGMVISNEPGFYADGVYGVRIENLLEVRYVKDEDNIKAEEENAAAAAANKKDKEQLAANGDQSKKPKVAVPGEKKYLKFSKLTMIPIQKNLIIMDLMSKEELDWLDSYHEEVLAKVGPLLPKDSPAMTWLTKACAKIERT